jgi:heat shock protein HtpX
LLFRLFYQGHITYVTKRLGIAILSQENERDANVCRFLRIGKEQCLALGIRLPQFGVIEVTEPNALAVGATRDICLIAVTRGLLETLDDEELAAVLAHEAAHIRNGDTKILAANHALMRTSVNIQVNNPLRFEDPKQAILILALPFFLPILLAGGAVTMLAMQMSFYARRNIALTRDLIADGDAIRLTHFPDALISALTKVAGRGSFDSDEKFQSLLFCAGSGGVENTESAISSRIKAITTLGLSMMDPNRVRRDTRPQAPRTLFKPQGISRPDGGNKERVSRPPVPSFLEILARPKCWVEYYTACLDYGEWKEGEKRDALGIKPQLYLPLAMVVAFLVTLHWPNNGDFAGSMALFNPASLIAMAAPGADTIQIFPGASAEAKYKQGYLAAFIMLSFMITLYVPPLRDRLYPNIDWTKRKQKSAGALLATAADTWSKRSFEENAIERELAKFKGEASFDRPNVMQPQIYATAKAKEPQPLLAAAQPRPTFGRKGI